MPYALSLFQSLTKSGANPAHAMAIAEVLQSTRDASQGIFDPDACTDKLALSGCTEAMAAAYTDALRHCFLSERFRIVFHETQLKTALVRAKVPAALAEVFLKSIKTCIVTSESGHPLVPIRHNPGPGKVVMCDFRYLRKPEMQKQRRAIIVSSRGATEVGRCTVVPVSMLEAATPSPHHFRFPPGNYPFFHSDNPVWAVCDHVYTVALSRLWQIVVRQRPVIPSISHDDLAAVRELVGTYLGVGR